MSYTKTFETLANRAIAQLEIDLEAFIANAIDVGIDPDVLQQMLIDDLFASGPLFGQFTQNLINAGGAATAQAHRSGIRVGEVAARDDLQDLLELNNLDIDAILDSGDAAELDRLEATTAPVSELMWVAELVNTCHLCLPLHGTIRTAQQWAAMGLHPRTIHPADWGSLCHCRLVDVAASNVDRKTVMAPLKRTPRKSPTGLRLGRRTVRAVAQEDMDKAVQARDKAMGTLEGRRTLRRAGMANK